MRKKDEPVWNDDVHLKHHFERHSNNYNSNNAHNNMEPLDNYVRYLELSEMSVEECHVNSSLVTNTSLSYLLDLQTPCSTGRETCVISFSLFCTGVRHTFSHPNAQCQRYTSHLIYLHGWKTVFSGWELRLYTDDSVPPAVLDPYRNVVTIITVNTTLQKSGFGTMWRLLPLWDEHVDRFITRDLDSLPLVRDWATTYEWIRLSHHQYPSYRWADHPKHYSHPIMAGALGVSRNALSDQQRHTLLQHYQRSSKGWILTKFGDQEWMQQHLYPMLREHMLSFDVAHCKDNEYARHSRPFPIPHSHCDFIMGGDQALFGRRDKVSESCRHSHHATWKWG